MLRNALPLVWIAALAIGARAWEHVSPAELESSLKSHSTVVVAFVAPSEDKSKSLEPEWVRLAPESKVPALSVDCTQADSCATYELSSYPSVKLFQDGVAKWTYQGPRRATAIFAWIERVQRPTVSTVDAEALRTFKGTDETVFVAFLAADDEESQNVFQELAGQYREEFTFAISTDAAALAAEELEAAALAAEELEAPAVKCYKPLDGDSQVLNGAFDSQSLDSFIKEASRPIIGELLPYNHQRFLDRAWPMVYVFASTEAERTQLRLTLNKMARGQYKSLTMVTVDPLEFPDLPAKLGLEPGVFPAGAVHQLSKDRIYPYPKDQPITSSALQQWGLDVWQSRIKPWTPAGATPAPAEDAPGRMKATRKVSYGSGFGGGIKINVGRDEL